jgi:hypothetical protein
MESADLYIVVSMEIAVNLGLSRDVFRNLRRGRRQKCSTGRPGGPEHWPSYR